MINDDIKTGALPEIGFVRERQLVNQPGGHVGILGISRTTLRRKIAAGEFPEPLKLSPGVSAWRVEWIRDWIANVGAPSSTHAA